MQIDITGSLPGLLSQAVIWALVLGAAWKRCDLLLEQRQAAMKALKRTVEALETKDARLEEAVRHGESFKAISTMLQENVDELHAQYNIGTTAVIRKAFVYVQNDGDPREAGPWLEHVNAEFDMCKLAIHRNSGKDVAWWKDAQGEWNALTPGMWQLTTVVELSPQDTFTHDPVAPPTRQEPVAVPTVQRGRHLPRNRRLDMNE